MGFAERPPFRSRPAAPPPLSLSLSKHVLSFAEVASARRSKTGAPLPAPPFRDDRKDQNAAVAETTTRPPTIDEPFLVDSRPPKPPPKVDERR